MIYDITLFSVGKNNYNLGFHNQQLLQYISVYKPLTANQNRLKPRGLYCTVFNVGCPQKQPIQHKSTAAKNVGCPK